MAQEHSIPDLITKRENDKLKEMLNDNPELANGKTEQGLSFLQLATYYRNVDAIAIIKEKKKSIDLFEAAGIGDLKNVQQHLNANPESINTFSNDGFTPLGLACFFGHTDLVRFLVSKGADVNKSSSNSFRVAPLHSAVAISNPEITTFLLENGADPNVKQQTGVTPLHSAAHNNQPNLVKLLVEYGADINAKTDDGKTPLDMALEKDFKETAEVIEKLKVQS